MPKLEFATKIFLYKCLARTLQFHSLFLIQTIRYRSLGTGTESSVYIIFRFDDASIDQYEIAFPLLEDFQCKAVLAVPTAYIGKRVVKEGNRVYRPIDEWSKLKEIVDAGWDVLPHGRHHLSRGPYMFLSEKELLNEVTGPKIDILENLGVSPNTFIPPGLTTHHNPLGMREIKAIFRHYNTLIMNSGYNYPTPIFNDLKTGRKEASRILWSIPSTDTDKWIRNFLSFTAKLKHCCKGRLVVIVFFHEVYDLSDKRTRYGFSKSRLQYLIKGLQEQEIPITSLSEALTLR